MVDFKGGTHTNISFERNSELKDIHDTNDGLFQGQFKSTKEEDTDANYNQI